MKNIAIITARSGSKGLPDKNIKQLNSLPLIAYSIKAAADSGVFDTIMVSTDSDEYAEVAKRFGAQVPFLRSKDNSDDNASSWDTVIEVLNNYAKMNMRFDTMCLLQPTSPLREADDIVNGYNLFNEKNADSVTAVCETDHSPLWCMQLDDSLSLKEYNKKSLDLPRQKLARYFRINGALYIRKIDYSDNTIKLLKNNDYAYIMPKERSIDIDNEMDYKMAEWFLNSK